MVICALWYCDEFLNQAQVVAYRLFCGCVSGAGEKEKERAKGKRKVKPEEDEDYRELPQKKHKLYGRVHHPVLGGGGTDVCPSGEAKLHPLRLQGENPCVGGLIGFGVPRIVMRE